MVLVCPVQSQRPMIDARAVRLQVVDDFLIKLSHLKEQLSGACTNLSDRMKRIENLPAAADYYYAVGCVDDLGNIFYQIKCDITHELEKIRHSIPGYLITIAQGIKGNSSEKHAKCLELSKRLQWLGDEILDSKRASSSWH